MGQEFRPAAEQNRKFKKDSRMGQEFRPVAEQNREFKKDSRVGQEYKNVRRPQQDGSEVQGVNKGKQMGLQDSPGVQYTGQVKKVARWCRGKTAGLDRAVQSICGAGHEVWISWLLVQNRSGSAGGGGGG